MCVRYFGVHGIEDVWLHVLVDVCLLCYSEFLIRWKIKIIQKNTKFDTKGGCQIVIDLTPLNIIKKYLANFDRKMAFSTIFSNFPGLLNVLQIGLIKTSHSHKTFYRVIFELRPIKASYMLYLQYLYDLEKDILCNFFKSPPKLFFQSF